MKPLTAVVILVAGAMFAADEVGPRDDERLKETALRSVESYVISIPGEDDRSLELHREPVIRFTTDSIDEGDIFLWTDAGRPAVAVQVFRLEESPGQYLWLHEFQSLADGPLRLSSDGELLWHPEQGGLKWQMIPADSPPSTAAALRLSQMKQLARRFSASEQTPGLKTNTDQLTNFELELKPRQILRYKAPQHGTIDGAVFWMTKNGESDPELLLIIEAFEGEQARSGWRYAAAPLTCWPVQLRLEDQQTVDIPNRYLSSLPTDPYHIWPWRPDE